MPDHRDLVVLDDDVCWEHLAACDIVRVGLEVGGRIDILPVNHLVLDQRVYWRSAAGTKLGAAAAESPVAIEADEIDPTDHTGWSVLLHGTVSIVTDETLRETLHALEHEPWTASDRRVIWVEVVPHTISGRVIR
jgi:nitroimidazol reductase NimA-like FMN-containing flavoprotein (pyridoxamine 5'-phosphate oxidase superfamily)